MKIEMQGNTTQYKGDLEVNDIENEIKETDTSKERRLGDMESLHMALRKAAPC